MRILDRYIFREVALAWVAVTGVLLVMFLSNQLTRVLSQAAAGRFSSDVVLTLLWLSSVKQLTVLVPIGLFLAIMLGLGRLYHESEMAAMHSGGLGLRGVYRPLGVLGALVAALLAWLSFAVVPDASARFQEIRSEALRKAQFSALEAGRFRSFAGGEAVFYAERVDDNGILHNVFLERNVEGRLEVIVATRAEQRGAGEARQIFVLYDGERYEGEPGRGDFRIVRFGELQYEFPIDLPQVGRTTVKGEEKPTAALLDSGDSADRAELQWRISVPLMVLVLTLLGVPLARLKPRQGRYARIGVFILVYFLYSNLLAAARIWVEQQAVPEAMGLWWVHALVIALALLMLARQAPSAGTMWRRRVQA